MKRYLLITTVLTLGLCLLVALFNYRVDPYGLYHFRQANADWLSRIDQFFNMRMTKPWQVLQTKPSAIVVGTSRSATVHPQHPNWPQNGGYNLSIPGMTMYEMLPFIEHAQAVQPLKKLMIGLDFEAFIQPEQNGRLGFEEARMARLPSDLASLGFAAQLAKDVRDTLFSTTGFARSLAAFTRTAYVGQRYEKDGTWESTASTMTGRKGFVFIGNTKIYVLRDKQLSLDTSLKYFADVLRFAHENNIDTRLFVTPEHVFMIDLWWRVGHRDLWNEFHRRVIEVNDTVAMELGVEAFPLFGFNLAEGIVDEPIRKARDVEHSQFTDGSHFRARLGKQIMDSVWSESAGLGVKLDADSVDGYLARVEQMRHDFIAANATLTATLRRDIAPDLQ